MRKKIEYLSKESYNFLYDIFFNILSIIKENETITILSAVNLIKICLCLKKTKKKKRKSIKR